MPLKTQRSAPKKAFLIPEIGGIKNGKEFVLKPISKYYFELQLQMLASELTFNILVVWTTKGIFTVEVPYNPSFLFNVCAKLEKVWNSQVLSFMMAEIFRTVFAGISISLFLYFSNANIWQGVLVTKTDHYSKTLLSKLSSCRKYWY